MNLNNVLLMASTDICGLAPTATSYSFLLLLMTGLLAGLSHCVGMCGPLATAFVLRRRTQQRPVTASLVIFQLGRLTTYMILGLLAGGLGTVVRFGIVMQGWQSVFSLIMGLLMMMTALSLLHWLPKWVTLGTAQWGSPIGYRVSRWIRSLLDAEHPAAEWTLGMSNGFLPCGAVYTMLLLAATTGQPLRGAGVMLLFGLGTVPALLGIGLFATQVSLRLRTHLYQAAAALVMLVGIQMVLRGLTLSQIVPHFSLGEVVLW